jgi:hypothetical protein
MHLQEKVRMLFSGRVPAEAWGSVPVEYRVLVEVWARARVKARE